MADVSDEVHVHAIDIHKNVTPGKPVTLRFTADIPGQFEVELEARTRSSAEFHIR